MRLLLILLFAACGLTGSAGAWAKSKSADAPSSAPSSMEVTADQSLEWYQDNNIYVARGHAKAIRDDLVVEADLLKAHEREKPAKGVAATPADQPAAEKSANSSDTGDIDHMEAEGHVKITNSTSRTLGDHAIYDLVAHTILVTGQNLRYETEKQTVTAEQSLEYYETEKIAVARGHAVENDATRHIEADVLTSEFAESKEGQNDLKKVTAEGHVVVVTKNDVARGDHGVYDAARNIAVITGHVQITRPDGMQLTGDVGEVDFNANQSRLLNSGKGRVRALLPAKTANKATSKTSGATAGNSVK